MRISDRARARRPPSNLFRAWIAVSVICLRAHGVHGVGHSRLLQGNNATTISFFNDPCETVPTTSLCNKGKLDYSFLMFGNYPGIDCLTYEAIQDVSALGASAFIDLEANCANMHTSNQGRKHPPLKYEEVVDGVMCVSQNWAPVFVADWDEANALTSQLQLSDCKSISTIVMRNTFQCRESTDPVCKGGALDLTVLDTQARPDCPAFEVRADVATRGHSALKDWHSYCATDRRRRTQYSNDCTGSQVNVRSFITNSSRSSADISYHWHYHSVRGLMYSPTVNSSGDAVPCRDNVCTADATLSCWPRPRFGTDPNVFNSQTLVYTCPGVTGSAHISGRSSGTYEMQGTKYTLGTANECNVSMPSSQRVRITCVASAWSDVWIQQLGNWTTVKEKPDLRNVCDP